MGAEQKQLELDDSDARAIIIASARSIIAHQGLEKFTFSAVSRDTSVPRNRLYELYATREDLFHAIIADDLSQLGRIIFKCKELKAMREVLPPPQASHRAARPAPVQLEDVAALLQVPNSDLGEGSASAVQSMQRRMGVLEHALADFEGRFDKMEKLTKDSVSSSHQSYGTLVERLEDTDKKLTETAKTLRGELLSAFTHLPPPAAATLADEAPTQPRPTLTQSLADSDLRRTGQRPPTANPVRKRKKSNLLSTQQLLGIGAAAIVIIVATGGFALNDALRARLEITSRSPQRPALPIERQSHPIITAAQAATPPDPIRAVQEEPATPQQAIPQQAIPASAPQSRLDRLTRLAELGNSKAALLTATHYLEGQGAPRNDIRAALWFRRAAEAGEGLAQYRLATLYQRGLGVTQDDAEALRWYQSAAAKGNRKAMHNSGVLYAEGRGVLQDYEKAAHWFEQAARHGYVDSQFDLGVLHERGEGVPHNIAQAYKWYSIAAKYGDQPARQRAAVLEKLVDPAQRKTIQAEVQAFAPKVLNKAANYPPIL